MDAESTFSPSLGWGQVVAWLRSDTRILAAVAGAFFLLPLLVFAFFGPEPISMATGGAQLTPEQLSAMIEPLIPWIIVLVIVQATGQLAMIAGVVQAGRPTVGEAIAIGARRVPYLILAYLVIALLVGVAGFVIALLVGALWAATGTELTAAGPAGIVTVVAAFALLAIWIFVYVRLSLIAVVLVAEEARWPFPLLRRSWGLTKGNAFRIFVFFMIVLVVAMIVLFAVQAVLGTILGMTLGIEPGSAGFALASLLNGIVSVAFTVIFTLMAAAIYFQLTGTTNAAEKFI